MNRRRGFTLIELLVVIGIIAILAVLALASVQGVSSSYRLQQSAAQINGALGLARQTAAAENVTTDVWFIADPSDPGGPNLIRGVWTFRRLPDGTEQPASRFTRLADNIAISSNASFSNIMAGSATPATGSSPRLPDGSQNYKYWTVSFDPDGETSLGATTGPWFFTLLAAQSASASTLPKNFITVRVDPINGMVSFYQP